MILDGLMGDWLSLSVGDIEYIKFVCQSALVESSLGPVMHRSMNALSFTFGSASPNRIPFGNTDNLKVVPSPPRWNFPDRNDFHVPQHEKENRKNTPFKAKWTPAKKKECSPSISSPYSRSTDDWSSDTDDDDDNDEDSLVSMSDVDFVHARLDASVSCCLCDASHALYLMYPIIKTLDTWNESSKYLCSICYADEDNTEEDLLESPAQPSGILFPKPRVLATRPMSRKTTTTLITKATCKVQHCLDVLHSVEEELDVAAMSLSQEGRRALEASIRRELAGNEQVEAKIQDELETVHSLWQLHWDLLSETAQVLQSALDQEGDDECDLLLAYYQWRAGLSHQDAVFPAWKGTADQALCQRDIAAGMGPGHFWGASRRADHHKRIENIDSKSAQDVNSDNSPNTQKKTNPDLIEELATLPESQVYQLLLPVRRGLGWSNCQPHDQSDEAEAYEAEANVPCIPRTEYEDRNLMKKEHYHEVRTILVMVEEEDMSTPELSSTEKINTIDSVQRPPVVNSIEASIRTSSSPTPKESLKRTVDSSPESRTLSWVPAKRAKRRCLRCVKFEGRSPTRCRGSKGRWGQKGCEYFTINGKAMK